MKLFFLFSTFYLLSVADIPTCTKISTDQEGWYWKDTGELIKLSQCGLAGEPICKNIGSKSEGWYAEGKLISWDRCDHVMGDVCVVDEDCAPLQGTFCQKPSGQCSNEGNCTTFPTDCSKSPAKPVCGCDGANYTNPCEAAMRGVSVDMYGPCQANNSCESNTDCKSDQFCSKVETMCADEGLCLPVPGLCTLQYEPVCGCDNVDYVNPCTAFANGTSVQYHGQCTIVDQCVSDSDCTITGQFCMKPHGLCSSPSTPGECTDKPTMCYLLHYPVCGCDGATYSNVCVAYSNGVNVNFVGSCA